MSLRTFERLLLASSLALGAGTFAGCSDGGGSSSNADAGGDAGKDSSVAPTKDAGTDDDAATEVEAPPTLTSDDGTVTCAPVPLTSKDTWADACWADDAHTVCGVDSNKLPGGDPTATTAACVAQDAPGKASTYCGAFFDQTDAVVRQADPDDPTGKKQIIVRDADGNPTFNAQYQDGALTVEAGGGIVLRFDGCCLPSGECGAILSAPRPFDAAGKIKVKAFDGTDFNLHLGCTSVPELLRRLGDPNQEAVDTRALSDLPFCDYAQDDPAAPTTGTVPGQPAFVCGCGEDKVWDYTNSPNSPCLSHLPTTVCGAEAITADSAILASIPQFVCGAEGSDPNLPPALKLANVPSTVCGTLPITDDSEQLNAIPRFLCGATGADPSPIPKLPNLSSDICGKLQVAADSPYLVGFPEFLCGCVDSNQVYASSFSCLPGVDHTVCGGRAITSSAMLAALTASATPSSELPVYVCGCGDGKLDSGILAVCLSNVDTTVCGTAAAVVNNNGTPDDATDDCLAGIPEYTHGCGLDGSPSANDPSCLRHSPALFGCDAVGTTQSATFAFVQSRVPEFLCGCGDGSIGVSADNPGLGTNGLRCLPFVTDQVCGGVNITPALQSVVSAFPALVCGCGEAVRSDGDKCFDNVATSICGSVPTAHI